MWVCLLFPPVYGGSRAGRRSKKWCCGGGMKATGQGSPPGLASSRTAEFKSQSGWKAQATPSPSAQDTQTGYLHKPSQGRGGRRSPKRTDPVPPPSHLLHSLRQQQLSVMSLLGTPLHLLPGQRDFEGWSKRQQPFWEGDPSWGLDRAGH